MIKQVRNQNLKDARFLVHPLPLEDELLSSWLVRLAYLHNTSPITFINLYIRDKGIGYFWRTDIDLTISNDLLSQISYKTRQPIPVLLSHTIQSYEGYLAEEIMLTARTVMLQPLGNQRKHKYGSGLRYCPMCLYEDKTPYFRKKWRLSFSTACIKHSCYLLDRCQSCEQSAAISIGREGALFPSCYHCGISLTQATPENIDPGSSGLVAIRKLYDILESGYVELGGRWIYSFSFFFIMRRIIRIVYTLGKHDGLMPEGENIDSTMFSYDKSHFANPDAIPIKKQYFLFLGIMKLFESYPESVIDYFNKNKVTRRDLTWGKVAMPFWCKPIIDSIDDRLYRPNQEEAWNAIRYARSNGLKIRLSRDGYKIGSYEYIWDRKFLISLLRDLGVDLEFV